MSTYNRDRFYYSQFDNALEAYRMGDLESPDNICRSLVSEFEVPRVVQARAYQLLSFCAGDEYWLARSYLERGLQLLESLRQQDPLSIEIHAEITAVREDLDRAWREMWAERGEEPPQQQEAEEQEGEADNDAQEGEADNVAQEMEETDGVSSLDKAFGGLQTDLGAFTPLTEARESSPATGVQMQSQSQSHQSKSLQVPSQWLASPPPTSPPAATPPPGDTDVPSSPPNIPPGSGSGQDPHGQASEVVEGAIGDGRVSGSTSGSDTAMEDVQ